MKLLKPVWVTHNGQPIFSVDIHPDGSRFATGGQGEDAGKIIIWNMGPVREENEEKDECVPKVLCQMDNHLACVNCVRWSRDGRFLASGGDDKLIMIWQTSRYGVGSTVFGSDCKVIESWRPVHTLRGHTGDVLDLAWSPSDVWFATCSIDNTVIVWNAEQFPEQVAVLKGHTGLVKGITWDPVGKYLATQSDDKTLRIWRTRDWQQEAVITEPFKECGGTTHCLRLDWSPDGHYVVSAHAMNNSGPTAQIIERDGWKTSLDFVGHRKAITVVRFNPDILSKKLKKDSGKAQQYSCCAIGSRDRSLSIWLTALKRPLVVTHDLFKNSVCDISWGRNGTELLCCSNDGTVAYLDFQLEEIGTPLAKEDVNRLLEKVYGKCLTKNRANNVESQIIESAEILKLQQEQRKNSLNEEKTRSSLSNPPMTPKKSIFNGMEMSNSPFKPKDKQIETKTLDGKRRITPIFLSAPPDVGDAPVPFSHRISFESSKTSSKIQVEKQDKITHSGFTSPPQRSQSMSSPPGKMDTTPKSVSPRDDRQGQASAASKPVDTHVSPLSALGSRPNKDVSTPKSVTSSPEKDKNKEKKVSSSLSLKRKHERADQPKKRGRPKTDGNLEKPRQTLPVTPVLPSHSVAVEPVTIGHIIQSELRLPAPDIEKHHSRTIQAGAGEVGVVSLEVENYIQCGSGYLHKLKLLKAGDTEWEQVLSSKVIATVGTRFFFCAACEDNSLSVFNTIGQKLLPNIVLSSRVSILDANGHYLLAVTQKGGLYVWNLQNKSAVIRNEPLSGMMTAEDMISRAFVTKEGVPVLSLTQGKSFSYSVDMGCWLLVSDRNDQVQQCSQHHSSRPKGSNKCSGTLSSLQNSQEKISHPAIRTFQTGQNLKQLTTLNHLETQLAACLSLKSSSEYKFWLQTYVRYLVQEGLESRLREVCNDLLGPMYNSKGKNSWDKTVLGMNKRELLKELLPYFSENIKRLQRLYTEFQEQLDTIESGT